MDELITTSDLYYHRNGDINESPIMTFDKIPVEGTMLTTAGERIPFTMFHAYTSIEGFAAYMDNDGKTSLINRAHIQRIFLFDNDDK